jgi:hypothetical protein
MPKRVIDFDAMWASDKIASCADWAQAEYAWLYGLADASGCFELTNVRVIWGRVSAIRKNLTLERLEQVLGEFVARGLLFTWEENGKRYGHWTGSDVPGRLPAPSWRARLERLAPPVPTAQLAAYTARYGSRRGSPAAVPATVPATEHPAELLAELSVQRGPSAPTCAGQTDFHAAPELTAALNTELQLKLGLELPQAQDVDLGLNLNGKQEKSTKHTEACASAYTNALEKQTARKRSGSPEQLLEIYEAGRGALPAAERLTAERRRQCARRLAAGFTVADFALAVRRAAQTPFLAGGGERGWRANFDWLIANDTNARRVLEGCYDSNIAEAGAGSVANAAGGSASANPNGLPLALPYESAAIRRGPAALYAGASPASLRGVRVKPEALERMRARDAVQSKARGSPAAAPADFAPFVASCPEQSEVTEPVRVTAHDKIRNEEAS